MVKREFSAGGIILKREGRSFKILLIKDSYGHWSWPKGKIEQGESPQEAALREVSEEVGLTSVRILGKAGESKYFFRFKGELISKIVHFFVMETRSEEKIRIQQSEIQGAEWFFPQDALAAMEYRGAKELLQKAIKVYQREQPFPTSTSD